MPVSITWLRSHRFSYTGLAPAQLPGLGRRSEIKYGLQLLPSCSQICTSPVRGFGVRQHRILMDCPDSRDHSGLGEETTVNEQTAYSGHSSSSSSLGVGDEGIKETQKILSLSYRDHHQGTQLFLSLPAKCRAAGES